MMGMQRGHPIYLDGPLCDLVWRYRDNDAPVADEWKERPCGHCGAENTPEGHDGCLGTIPGALNACCGHGSPEDAYVQFADRTIRGPAALAFAKGARP